MKSINRWFTLGMRWVRILTGKSYYHQPQRLGKAFRPGEIAGYFNDLTRKTWWSDHVDEEGIPVNILHDGRKVYFATTIVQKALGHWDQWLLTHNPAEKEEFLKLCRWLLRRQDERGGWPIWSELGLSLPSPYSAMTQGECISAFVRAWRLTEDFRFEEGARRAYEIMRMTIENGGPAVVEGDSFFLEEVPATPRSSILNGWIFAIFGIYDFWLTFQDDRAQELFQISLATLKRHLADYDAGWWSYYDIRRHIASPYYHELHIHQLSALVMVDSDAVIMSYMDRWIRYQKNWLNCIKALGVKAWQKLKEPGEVVITR